MKILYSQLEQFIPTLKSHVESKNLGINDICDAFTLIGHMVDGLTDVKYQEKADYLISLEIRQNRADCLSVIGLAKELASYYGLEVELPYSLAETVSKELKINVQCENAVKRIKAIEFKQAQNDQSPAWLQELLKLFDINPVNLLVDISNYVMILTGYPSHLLDKDKMEGNLSWTINDSFDSIVTLDGTQLKLHKNEVILEDEKNILALAGIVGGKTAEIDGDSKNIIAEMAIYDRALIRRNARDLHVMTEASNRLEKDLDPNGIDYAMQVLEKMIVEYAKGEVAGRFSYYPNPRKAQSIEFSPENASRFAGVEIIPEQSVKILKDLRFEVEKKGNKYLVKAPTDRMDIELEEDVIEEVIRIYGYNKIPFEEVPEVKVVKNITPSTIKLADKIRDILSASGYDEALSWPLTDERTNALVKQAEIEPVRTVNSVNEEFPELRASIATGLLNQLNSYKKMNVPLVKIFEIGKVFGKWQGKYIEEENIGILHQTSRKNLQEFKFDLENIIRSLGIFEIGYSPSGEPVKIANPKSAWKIILHGNNAGAIYKLRTKDKKEHTYFAEIKLSTIAKLLEKPGSPAVAELTKKIVTLDANVILQKDEKIDSFLEKIRNKIGANKIWDLWISDTFAIDESIKYTIRVSYLELTDEEAKKIHLEAFGLKN